MVIKSKLAPLEFSPFLDILEKSYLNYNFSIEMPFLRNEFRKLKNDLEFSLLPPSGGKGFQRSWDRIRQRPPKPRTGHEGKRGLSEGT